MGEAKEVHESPHFNEIHPIGEAIDIGDRRGQTGPGPRFLARISNDHSRVLVFLGGIQDI